MAELVQVLPALSRTQIKRLMEELALANRVHLRGVTRNSRWFIGPVPTTPIGPLAQNE